MEVFSAAFAKIPNRFSKSGLFLKPCSKIVLKSNVLARVFARVGDTSAILPSCSTQLDCICVQSILPFDFNCSVILLDIAFTNDVGTLASLAAASNPWNISPMLI